MYQFETIQVGSSVLRVARTSAAYMRYRVDLKFKTPEAKEVFGSKLHDVRRRKLLRCCEQQGYRCCYCGVKTWHPSYGETGNNKQLATLEHVVPRSQGGSDSMNNLAMACWRCNNWRNDSLDAEEFYEIVVGLKPYRRVLKEKVVDPETVRKQAEHHTARQTIWVLRLAYLTQEFNLWAWWDYWLTYLAPMLDRNDTDA